MTFVDLLCFGYLDFQWRDRNSPGFIKKKKKSYSV